MSNITLTSCLGSGSPELALIRHGLLAAGFSNIVDLTHEVSSFDIATTAYTVFYFGKKFPDNSVHLCLVETSLYKYKKIILTEIENHYIISADNGIPFLLYKISDEKAKHFLLYELNEEEKISNKHIYVDSVNKFSAAMKTVDFKSISSNELKTHPHSEINITENLLKGKIVFSDTYGNLITNISKNVFNEFIKGRKFEIILRQHDRRRFISDHINEVVEGEIAAVFNSFNLLEIGLNRENAMKLLGMKTGMDVMVELI